jgi:hypothetical protein
MGAGQLRKSRREEFGPSIRSSATLSHDFRLWDFLRWSFEPELATILRNRKLHRSNGCSVHQENYGCESLTHNNQTGPTRILKGIRRDTLHICGFEFPPPMIYVNKDADAP